MADVSKLAALAAKINAKSSPNIRAYAVAQAAATVAQEAALRKLADEVAVLRGSGPGTRPPEPDPVPANTSAPTVAGTAEEGQTLTAAPGTWTASPTGFSYQWRRCNSGGSSCTDIPGATSQTYVVAAADAGKTLRVSVVASNAAGPGAAATSAPTAVVTTPSDLGSSLPARLPMSSGSVNYYVNPVSGNDTTGDGTAGAPWKTINKAIASVSTPGAIINVADGTYIIGGTGVANSPIYIRDKNHAGTIANPITIKAVNEGQVVITHPTDDVGAFYGSAIWNSSGYRIQGIKFYRIYGHAGSDHPGADCAFIYSSQWVEYYRCEFVDIGGQMQMRGTLNDPCTDIGVWCCKWYPSGGKAVNYNGLGNDYEYAAGVTCTGDYFTTRGTHMIYPGQVEGGDYAGRYGVDRLVIANCLFVGKVPGCHLDLHPQCRDSYVVNNTFYGNDKPYFTRGGQNSGWSAGNGIIIGNDGHLNANTSRNVIVKNNIFASLKGHAVRTDGAGDMVGNIVDENLAYQTDNGSGLQGNTGRAFEYEWSTGDVNFTSPGGNLVGQNPLFTAPAKTGAGDFTLQGGSPAIGVAEPGYAPPTDYNGDPRSSTPSLGALEP